MITIRKSSERGHFDYGWLNTYHTFSFNTYYDVKYMSFRTLRVINEDVVIPHQGFDTHSHKDMEIITYIVEGELEHTDSTGTSSVIKRGDVQVMTAGSGVEHSEINSSNKSVHLLQIWITPSKKGLTQRYDEKHFPEKAKKDSLCLMVSGDGKNNSLMINQDVSLFSSMLYKNKKLSYNIEKKRAAWIQVISGELKVNDIVLVNGDGASIEHEKSIEITAKEDSEFLLFDLM